MHPMCLSGCASMFMSVCVLKYAAYLHFTYRQLCNELARGNCNKSGVLSKVFVLCVLGILRAFYPTNTPRLNGILLARNRDAYFSFNLF